MGKKCDYMKTHWQRQEQSFSRNRFFLATKLVPSVYVVFLAPEDWILQNLFSYLIQVDSFPFHIVLRTFRLVKARIGTCWHYLMMSHRKKMSLFFIRICCVINQTRYENVSHSEGAKRLNSI